LPPTQPAPPSYDPTLLPVSSPYASVPAPAVQGGRSAVLVLSVLLGLFVLASATLGVLYVQQGQESIRQSEQIATLEAANASALRQLGAAERDLRGADKDLADARTERDAITDCLTAIYDWWDALDETGGVTRPTPRRSGSRRPACAAAPSNICRSEDQPRRGSATTPGGGSPAVEASSAHHACR
jgi:hypothetical protein